MLNFKDNGIILMIISHCDRIMNKLKDIKEADFCKDNDLQEIVAFNLLQISELTSKLSNEFLDEYKDFLETNKRT